MSQQIVQENALKLSICITTRNRAHVIGRTLESILCQMTEQCEVVVLDAASTDNTEECVREYARQSQFLRYFKADTNNGLDADFDRTVELARGEYCWLMADDDLFKPWAVGTVLETLKQDFSLVIANAEDVDVATMRVLEGRRFQFNADRVYGPDELDSLFSDTCSALTYIGCVVIKRSVWIARDRRRYFGSFWTHLGVIFQKPLPEGAKVIVKPLVEVSQGNERRFGSSILEIFCYNLPKVIKSLAISHAAMTQSPFLKLWKSTEFLMLLRACELYSFKEYRRWIFPEAAARRERVIPFIVSLLPVGLSYVAMISYYSIRSPRGTPMLWLRNRRI